MVFVSSCLANQQYDVQLLFKLIESMDKETDLLSFIRAHASPFPGQDIQNILAALGISSTPVPVPPPALGPEQLTCDPAAIDPAYPVVSPRDLRARLGCPAEGAGGKQKGEGEGEGRLTQGAGSLVAASAVLPLLLAAKPYANAVGALNVAAPYSPAGDFGLSGSEEEDDEQDDGEEEEDEGGEDEEDEEEDGLTGLWKRGGAKKAGEGLRSPVAVRAEDGEVEWAL